MAKKKPRLRRFNPTAPTYKYQRGFNRAVKKRARSQVQPLLSDIRTQRREATSAHGARESDIDKYYGFDLSARQSAYDKINTALNGLITGNAGLSDASQQALSAALRGSADTENQQAALLGAAPTRDPEAAIRAGAAMGDVSTLGTLGNLEAVRGSAARDIGLSGVGHREAGMTEADRYRALLKELTSSRSDVMSTLPGIRETVRQQMGQEELGKAGQRFQQKLANKQFNFSKRESGRNFRLQKSGQKFQEELAGRQQTETERSNKSQENLSQQGVDTERKRLKADIQAAKGTANEDQAKVRADRFNAGIETLTEWFKPTKQETGKGGRMGPKQRAAYIQRLTHGYDEMVQQVMASTGMGPIDARRVVLAAADRTSDWGRRWVRRASGEIIEIKKRRKYGDQPNPTQAHGGPAGP